MKAAMAQLIPVSSVNISCRFNSWHSSKVFFIIKEHNQTPPKCTFDPTRFALNMNCFLVTNN